MSRLVSSVPEPSIGADPDPRPARLARGELVGAIGAPSDSTADASGRSDRVADLAEDVERLERLAGADHHRRERVLGEEHGQARSPRAAGCPGS